MALVPVLWVLSMSSCRLNASAGDRRLRPCPHLQIASRLGSAIYSSFANYSSLQQLQDDGIHDVARPQQLQPAFSSSLSVLALLNRASLTAVLLIVTLSPLPYSYNVAMGLVVTVIIWVRPLLLTTFLVSLRSRRLAGSNTPKHLKT